MTRFSDGRTVHKVTNHKFCIVCGDIREAKLRLICDTCNRSEDLENRAKTRLIYDTCIEVNQTFVVVIGEQYGMICELEDLR